MPTQTPRKTNRPLKAAAIASVLPLAISMIPTSHAGQGGTPVSCGIHCGTERWTVKTLSDAAASAVVLAPQTTTVSKLVAIVAPAASPAETRDKAEMQAVSVEAQLLGYKQELSAGKGDHDFHIVIADPRTQETMIVEIPDPQCDGVCNSTAHDQIIAARSAFSSAVTTQPASSFVGYSKPVRVIITGVPLFDYHHGQTGVAKNCIEIHPVLSITFPDGAPTETPHTGKSPPALPAADYSCIPV